MGAIEDIYEDLDGDVPFEEFETAVHDKVEQMGGLADEETAAMLVAHELEDEGGEVEDVADIEPGMDEVQFVAKVASVGDLRTFERDGDDEGAEGRVINVEVADGSGRVRLAFWDRAAQSVADGEIEAGDVLRIAGRPKEGYNGLEVSVDNAEIDEDAEVDVQLLDTHRVEDLALGQSDVTLTGKVLDTDTVRTFDRDDGSEGRVSNLTVGDGTGRVRVTLWDERADRATEIEPGTSVEIVDGYVRERDGDLELHVGSRGAIEEIDEDVEYVPDSTAIEDLEIGDTADLVGGVIETDQKRTFDRDDGSEGQVRNIRVRDDTGEIRVALWGDKADMDIDLADRVSLADVEIQEGWQDDLEASAGWRSTVSVLDGGADVSAGTESGSVASGASDGTTGLDDFGGDDTEAAAAAATTAPPDSDGGTVESATAGDADDVTEFTGTVVQAGNPVVLDNGQQTRSVETGEQLRLGEEVTVRGPMRDGRIDADEVF